MSQSSVEDNVMQGIMAKGRGRGSRGGVSVSAPVTQAGLIGQPQARVYAVTRHEASFLLDVVTGILSICGFDANILIDP